MNDMRTVNSPVGRATRLLRYLGQAMAYTLFAVGVGYFAAAPAYQHLPADTGVIKLSFSHAAERLGACRERDAQELAALPPNMRQRLDCPRERAPVAVEVALDGQLLYRDLLQPSGFKRDGAANAYRRFRVATGAHRLALRLNDRARATGYNYIAERDIQLAPAQVLVVDFDPVRGGFVLK